MIYFVVTPKTEDDVSSVLTLLAKMVASGLCHFSTNDKKEKKEEKPAAEPNPAADMLKRARSNGYHNTTYPRNHHPNMNTHYACLLTMREKEDKFWHINDVGEVINKNWNYKTISAAAALSDLALFGFAERGANKGYYKLTEKGRSHQGDLPSLSTARKENI